jgi:hypothetical protein
MIGMYPGALLPQISDLQHKGIYTCSLEDLPECMFVFFGGASGNDDPIELVLLNFRSKQVLPGLCAHQTECSGQNNIGQIGCIRSDRFNINDRLDIGSALAYKNTDSRWQWKLPPTAGRKMI